MSGGFSDSAKGQHYSSAYYGSSWQSTSTPSTRVATLPSYGKKAMRQQDYQRQNRNSSQQAQLSQFQTLADTGLYLGLSLSKGQYSGTLQSQYCDPELPGNCNEGSGANQSSTGMGLTFGVAVSSATRI
ncbi:MAG: hypothetical protein JXR30_00275, partial [Alphaproteobacteria bacterium]|nr:hypothetical protein [Alphaproteobacteria bacterium]